MRAPEENWSADERAQQRRMLAWSLAMTVVVGVAASLLWSGFGEALYVDRLITALANCI